MDYNKYIRKQHFKNVKKTNLGIFLKKNEMNIKTNTKNLLGLNNWYYEDGYIVKVYILPNITKTILISNEEYIEKVVIVGKEEYEFKEFDKYMNSFAPFINSTLIVYFNSNILLSNKIYSLKLTYYLLNPSTRYKICNKIHTRKSITFSQKIYFPYNELHYRNFNNKFKIYHKTDLLIPVRLNKICNKQKCKNINFYKNYGYKNAVLVFKHNINLNDYIVITDLFSSTHT